MSEPTKAENCRRMKIGQAIANQLKPLRPLHEVAKAFGITAEMVRQIEAKALYKVASRMKKITNFEEAI